MNNEIISLEEITEFKSSSEEFSPYAWYKDKLQNDPVSYNEATNTWNVFRYNDVKRVLSDYEHFSNVRTRTTISVGADVDEGKHAGKFNLMTDPPEHRKSRSLLAAAFTPRSLKLWEPRIQEIVSELIDSMEDKPVIDIVDEFASALPTIVIADLLGVPTKDRMLFQQWVYDLFLPMPKENQETVNERKRKAAVEYYSYLYPYIVQKRSNLSDDIISDLIRAEVDGDQLSDDDIVRTTMFILGAGIETTSHLLANTFYSFLYDNKEIYNEVRTNRELLPNTVEEMLRYRFNVAKMDRTVKVDNNLLGVDLKKGDVVVAWMSAANMDGEVFEDPFTLNIHRPNNKQHLTFGNGPHFCLGAPLARLEAITGISMFMDKFARIEPVPGFNLEENLTPSAAGKMLSSLPVRVYRK
ncbi:cytochrome P450 [Paenibacillus sp. FSL H7-0326]|uniref:cytochrome P450 n=1 Tax=Paenibacillus sp. FSL H7-0326 TaxID=1921144 RepID=UPI00096F2DDC|nr:cytochrome P450 [Paenibacillus sp. FSL H7-0326]OMC70643.1 cytochrome P450 [Paenibacillus sp. FSL H7-0326]